MKWMIAPAAVLIACCACAFGDDVLPTIDTYDFQWTVCKSGEASLVVEKTQDATTIEIHGSGFGDHVTVAPKDAPAIGEALKATDEHWRAMKDSDKEVSENVDAGKYKITFHNDPKYGFSVWIKDGDSDFSMPASFDRDVVKAFAPFLRQAPKLAALVDQKIQP